MTNSYMKFGNAWAIRSPKGDLAGTTVPVTTRAGAVKQVTLRERVGQAHGGEYIYLIAERAAAETVTVGDLSRINALFDANRAAQPNRRKTPAIVFADFRISVAGQQAREPGCLTILSNTERNDRGGRKWLGRVTKAGVFEPARDTSPVIGEALKAFAADPAGVAAAHGQVTHACCFCNKTLTDPRSRTVGYGPDCAGNFGLPWGAVDDTLNLSDDEMGINRPQRSPFHSQRYP